MTRYVDMENLRLYKTKVALPVNEQFKQNGNLIYLNTNSLQESINLMNSQLFKFTNYYKAYFIDFLYRFKIFNKPVNEKIENADIYMEVTDKCPNIIRTYRLFENYKDYNVYVDMHKYNNHFNENVGMFKGDRVLKEYLQLLNMVDSNRTYENKIMILDLDAMGVNLKDSDTYKYSKADNPFEILYSLLLRYPEDFKKINFDILLISGIHTIKIKPSMCDEKSISTLKANLAKIRTSSVSELEDVDSDNPNGSESSIKEDKKERVLKKFSFNGDDEDEISSEVAKKVSEILDKEEDLDEDELEEKVKEEINEDDEFLAKLELIKTEKVANISSNNLKRNQLLCEKQAKVKINNSGKTIEDILAEANEKTIAPKKIKIDTINTKMQEVKLPNFEKEYNEKLLDKDTVAILNFFKDRSVPVYVLDIKKEDTSDNFNKKYTYTVKFESADRERHTVKFDMPKFVQDNYMYLGGNKKSIVKQLVLKPVSKTGPNTVQICTNYNKIFMSRSGTKTSPKMERMKKILTQYKDTVNINYKEGYNTLANSSYKTTIEYDELGANYMYIKLYGELEIHFNQEELRNLINANGLKFDSSNPDHLPVGLRKGKNGKLSEIIILDTENDKLLKYDKSLADFIIAFVGERNKDFLKDMNSMTIGKKYMYTSAKVMHKNVPLLLFLAYLEGLTKVMNKAGIKYEFSDSRVQLKDEDKSNRDIVQFADGYLIYDRYPMRNSLLMNALSLIPTKNYNYSDLDSKDVYLEIFENLLGVRMIVNAFDNFYDLLIDPITYEVLNDLNMPTDFVELLLFANNLLEDNQYMRENNMSLYRLRSNEVANAYLYKALAEAYSRYRITAGNKNPVKMSIPQNEVIKNMVTSPIVEDYSTLNPVLEAEKARAVTFKGPSGRLYMPPISVMV